jgi:TonB family protein
MLQNEQGDVKLSFTVDPMGHPANIRLLSSSGSQTLDLQSIRLSNSKWTYESVQPGAAVEVTFSWQLPVERVGDYDIKIAAPARNAPPPAPIQSHAVVVDDYPPLSIRTGETGIVGIRYVVKTDGSVGLVEIAQSSGIKRLDDAAANMVKTRWRFQPLGAETEMSATVSFHVIPPRNLLRCAASPVFADEEVFIAGTLV